jgi:hypothetical protein
VRAKEYDVRVLDAQAGSLARRPGTLAAAGIGALSRVAAWRRRMALAALGIALSLALLAPAPVSASFTRPFVRQITGTPSGPFSATGGPGGLAIDEGNNLWVGDHLSSAPFELDEFGLAELGSSFLAPSIKINGEEEPPVPQSLNPPQFIAIDNATGAFYTTAETTVNGKAGPGNFSESVEIFGSAGNFVSRFGPLHSPSGVAVDNSTEPSDPSIGSVYVTHPERASTPPQPNGISKFNANGEKVNFSGSASYISGNEIVGTAAGEEGEFFKQGHFGTHGRPEYIAVDTHGNIYAAVREALGGSAVVEYGPTGLVLREFPGSATPGLGEGSQRLSNGGFGGEFGGLAVDPVSGHLLVSIRAFPSDEGAVDEFDSTGRFLNQITTTAAGAHLRSAFGLAVDGHGYLYVVDSDSVNTKEHAVDVYGPGHFLPSLKLGEATERTPASATLGGSIDPEGLVLSDCHFEYVTEAAYTATGFADLSSGGAKPCVPAAASIPADSEYHSVSAELGNLAAGTTYRYRLAATSSGALGGSANTTALAFTTPHAPRVDSFSAANLSSTFADLRAQIDPLGADTDYYFQYVDAARYEPFAEDPYAAGATVPTPAADIGSGGPTGSSDESVLQQIGGLQPATVYHFRVVAANECEAGMQCVTDGPDATFATLPQASPGLPDNRAYELVTPPNKGSAGDMFGASEEQFQEFVNRDYGYASETGDGFYLETGAAFGPFPASAHNAYVFSRTDAGWAFTSLASPSLGVQSLSVGAFDPVDFSQVGLLDVVGSQGGTAGSQGTSLLGPPGGAYTNLHADSPVQGSGAESESTRIVGGARNLSKVVIESENHTLAPGASAQDEGSASLYESAGGGECTLESSHCTLLNLNPKGGLLRCGAILGQNGQRRPGGTYRAVSVDGSRAFFTAPDPNAVNDGPGCWNGKTENAPQLYMRSASETTELSASGPGAPEPAIPGNHPAIYVGASADGSKVFFLSEAELTKDDAGIHDTELYEWEAEGTGNCDESSPAYNPSSRGCLTRISHGESGSIAATVETVPTVSADGSAVYFTARGQLTAGAPPPGEVNKDQGVDLYRYDTTTGATAYIATITRHDFPTDATGGWWRSAVTLSVQVALEPYANFYTTPDGRYLLFSSEADLTGYSTVDAHAGARQDCPTLRNGNNSNSGHCAEVYRYDSAAGGSLACLSCAPTGALPTSNAFFATRGGLELPSAGPVRAISDDGSYAFFVTAESLVPQDTNDTLDVYEWHNGNVSLISSGQDAAPSYFLGASPDGSNVFFGTHAHLVPADGDTVGDVYDARICTKADACIAPAAGETAQCEGDSCQSPPPVPVDASPGSLTFSGLGEILTEVPSPLIEAKKTVTKKAAVQCKKPKKPKKPARGKCAKPKARKKAKARKASNDGRAIS